MPFPFFTNAEVTAYRVGLAVGLLIGFGAALAVC